MVSAKYKKPFYRSLQDAREKNYSIKQWERMLSKVEYIKRIVDKETYSVSIFEERMLSFEGAT
jgi:hypothetical protein